jgi:hypothetical protein
MVFIDAKVAVGSTLLPMIYCADNSFIELNIPARVRFTR